MDRAVSPSTPSRREMAAPSFGPPLLWAPFPTLGSASSLWALGLGLVNSNNNRSDVRRSGEACSRQRHAEYRAAPRKAGCDRIGGGWRLSPHLILLMAART